MVGTHNRALTNNRNRASQFNLRFDSNEGDDYSYGTPINQNEIIDDGAYLNINSEMLRTIEANNTLMNTNLANIRNVRAKYSTGVAPIYSSKLDKHYLSEKTDDW
jgi:hypothetical protein